MLILLLWEWIQLYGKKIYNCVSCFFTVKKNLWKLKFFEKLKKKPPLVTVKHYKHDFTCFHKKIRRTHVHADITLLERLGWKPDLKMMKGNIYNIDISNAIKLIPLLKFADNLAILSENIVLRRTSIFFKKRYNSVSTFLSV